MPNYWSLLGTVNPAPSHALSVSSNTLDFGSVASKTTADKKITLSATTLGSNITVSSPPQYQVSTDSLNFANTVTISRDTTTIPGASG